MKNDRQIRIPKVKGHLWNLIAEPKPADRAPARGERALKASAHEDVRYRQAFRHVRIRQRRTSRGKHEKRPRPPPPRPPLAGRPSPVPLPVRFKEGRTRVSGRRKVDPTILLV